MATVVRIPATGRKIVSDRIKGSGTEPKRIAWGNGTTPPVDGDTSLETPGPESIVDGTSSIVTTTTADDTYRVIGTLTSTIAQVISEAALLNNAGDLFLRATFDGISLETGDSIQFTMEGQAAAPA